MKKIHVLLSIISFSLSFNCVTGFNSKKLLYRTSQIALFTLPKNNIEDKELIPEKINHPINGITGKMIKSIFSKINFIKNSSIGGFEDTLLNKKDLDRIVPELETAFKYVGKDNLLILVVLSNESNSVMPSFTRTTMLLWIDAKMKLNVVLGEIDRYIPYEFTIKFSDWGTIKKINLYPYNDNNEVLSSNQYTFQLIKGFPNKRWLIFDLGDVAKFNLKLPIEKKDTTPPKTEAILHKEGQEEL